MKKSKQLKKIKWIKFLIIVVLSILIYLSLLYSVNKYDVCNNIFDFLNNQTVAILIGFLGTIIVFYLGYENWLDNHNFEICDKYFEEYVNSALLYFSIKSEELDLRKELNRIYWEEWERYHEEKKEINNFDKILLSQRIKEIKRRIYKDQRYLNTYEKYSSLIRQERQKTRYRFSKILLLKKFKKKKYEVIERIIGSFSNHFRTFVDFTKTLPSENSEENATPRRDFKKYLDRINELLVEHETEVKNLKL